MKKQKYQSGFARSTTVIVIVSFLVIVLGFVGWKIYLQFGHGKSFAVTLTRDNSGGNTANTMVANTVVQTDDGGYAIAGFTSVSGINDGDGGAFISKFDSNGKLSWKKTWGSESDGRYTVNSIIQTDDGGYAIAGKKPVGKNDDGFATGENAFIAKFDSNGKISWVRSWGSTESGGENIRSIIQTADGGYAVAGNVGSFGAGSIDAFVAKFDSSGKLTWSKTWGGTNYDQANSIASTPDGGYVITGYVDSYGAGSEDAFIAKFDSSGKLAWSKTWGGAYYDVANSIVVTADKGFVIAGGTKSYGSGAKDAFIAKFDSNGKLSWSKTWGGEGDEVVNSAIQAGDKGYVISGYYYAGKKQNAFIAKFTSDGELIWSKAWDGGAKFNRNAANSIIQTADSGYVIAGYTGDKIFANALIVKYKSDGTVKECSKAMCYVVKASLGEPSVTVGSPSVKVTSPIITTSSNQPAMTTLKITSTVLVKAN